MLRLVVGAFLALHGLVHLLYFGHSQRVFELQPGLAWPEGSWAFSTLVGNDATRVLASVSCVVAAAGFVAGGLGVAFRQAWWRPMVVGSAAFSALAFILFWDGGLQRLADKGVLAILINAAILASVLVLRWPESAF